MKFIFTELERKWILTLPVPPSDFEWGKTRKTDTYEALYQDVDDIGNKDLRQYTIESFIPDHGSLQGKKYAFQVTPTAGREVVRILDEWLEQKTALRLVVTANDGRTLENIIVKITDLKFRLDRVGDYVYSMQITEHVPLYQ